MRTFAAHYFSLHMLHIQSSTNSLRSLSLTLSLLASATVALAKNNQLYTTENNLPNTLINNVIESRDEMIWIATENGLCRFDGARFVTYTNSPDDPHTIQSNFVRDICADARGNVFVATISGAQLYRPATDDFSDVIIDPEQGISSGNVSSLCLLANGDIFATGNTTFTIHIDEAGNPHAIPNAMTEREHMTSLSCQDREGNIWVINYNDGLFRISPNDTYEQLKPNRVVAGFISMGVGADGCIYGGGLEHALYKYNPDNQDFDPVDTQGAEWQVRDICPLPGTYSLLLSTDGDGLRVYDCLTGQITPYVVDQAQFDLTTQKVHAVTVSQHGDIWMALYQKGVFVESANSLDFHYYGSKSQRYNNIGNRCVTSIIRSQDGTLWVATDNDGIYGIDRQGQTVAHYDCTSHGGPLPTAIQGLYQDSRGRVWFGSYRQTCGYIDLKTGHCTNISIQGRDDVPFSIYAFAEDKRGRLWVGSMGEGILYFDEQQHQFIRQETLQDSKWTNVLTYDAKRDVLYAGTYDGLITIDVSQQPLRCTQFSKSSVVYSITLCPQDRLALCTHNSLIVIDLPTGEQHTYTTNEGLPNNSIYAVLPDDDGNLWISGSVGLSRLSADLQTLISFTEHDGLLCSEFYKNTAHRDADGTLWFGGTQGITWFDPKAIDEQKRQCVARVVNVTDGENNVLPDASGDYYIADGSRSFTVELATRPIMMSRSVSYTYSLDGDRWQTLPAMSNHLSFSHIAPGRHLLRFQVLTGGQPTEVQQVAIYIAYPWYRTWWAYLLWFLLCAIAVIGSWRQYRRMRREKMLLHERERETAINEAKLQFFMNIAHDIRTPMTLVVSPLRKLMSIDKDATRQHSYQLMDRNANRVLVLVNELMDLRKLDQEQMQLHCHLCSPDALLHDLCDSVSDLVAIRKLSLTLDDKWPGGKQAWIDQDCFEKVVINLLSNAIKYTPEGGHIVVSSLIASHPRLGECLQVMVTDTGIGIAEADRQHIFERFYQVRQAHSMGTGIGLNLAHALVNLHHGLISVDDNPAGQGTRFSVYLPLDEQVYAETEKVELDASAPVLHQEITSSDLLHSTLRELDAAQPADDSAANPHTHYRVLVVDDDQEVRDYLVHELQSQYRVLSCCNGREALQLLQREEPHIDLVVSDVMMPEMDGIELCQRIRSNVRLNHLPVILLTAKATDEDRLQSLEIGANAFLSKPFNVTILTKTMKNLIDQQTRLRSSFSGQQLPVDKVETPMLQSPDERLMERVLAVINANLSNPDLTSEYIAEAVGLSRVHLYRKLKEITNQSARNYIRNIRLAKAAELLSQKKMAVAEVAYKVGFSNPNNFATAFREMYGVSPTEFMSR